MTVSLNRFSHLNDIFEAHGFPQKRALKRTGEVVSIDVFDPFPLNGRNKMIASMKRKLWYVSAGRNAYWLYRGLRSEIVAWESENGISRDDRTAFNLCIQEVVCACYFANCVIAGGNQLQYFRVSRNAVVGGIECVVWLDDLHLDSEGWGKPIASIFSDGQEVVNTPMFDLSDEEVWERRYALLGLDVKYPTEI